jgi:hypothetical protein
MRRWLEPKQKSSEIKSFTGQWPERDRSIPFAQ